MTQTVAVIDYGMGNLHSVASALHKVADASGHPVRVLVTNQPDEILNADRVILPGVGAIRDCVGEIKHLGLDFLVKQYAQSGRPLLGICVGLQALMQHSEENGGVDCLGLFPGEVTFFGKQHKDANGNKLKVPHMGWNTIHHNDHPLWDGIDQDSHFYFVHSYCVQCPEPSLVMASADYGIGFHAALGKDNVFAVQFHPEKSGDNGLRLLQNFLAWQP